MKTIEPGHVYELEWIDAMISPLENIPPETLGNRKHLVFVNREGNPHPGTQTQEVIRALIDRTQHCDSCLHWDGNDQIIHHLRMALVLHEARALERKTDQGEIEPETFPVGVDGHFLIDGAPS